MGLHGVVLVFMGVDVLSKIKEAMLVELNRLIDNHGSRAKSSRDTILGGEAIDPERHIINDLVQKETWDASI